jgi:Arc/MetJ-type ribon-helix-helix transcriptional regulator
MTKKIGISLRDELYEWVSREVEEGRAESVSALIAEGLAVLEARSRLEAPPSPTPDGLARALTLSASTSPTWPSVAA